jgi:hypothetical protein
VFSGLAFGHSLTEINLVFDYDGFSTVGYGDFYPISPLGKLWVIGMIVVAILIVPEQFGRISTLTASRAQRGGDNTVFFWCWTRV